MAISSDDSLIKSLDNFFQTLIEECQPTTTKPVEGESGDQPPPISFLDRLKLFEAGARWVGVKNKIDDGDATDEFSRLRAGHVGRTGGGRKSSSTSRPNGSA